MLDWVGDFNKIYEIGLLGDWLMLCKSFVIWKEIV